MHTDPAWLAARRYTVRQLALAEQVLCAVRAGEPVEQAVRRYAAAGQLPKHLLVHAYRSLVARGAWAPDPALLRRIRMKPVRTLSGVATVSVLTRPYPCPGQCLYCPEEPGMPRSYLASEPGGRRAVQHEFDPHAQTFFRLRALEAIGHPTDKVELLILGGTWSAYPAREQRRFVRRCLDALNGFDARTLEQAQEANAAAPHRNVGLVVETRPDRIDAAEIRRLRALGVTKVQLGAQSLDDRLLALNRRGHTTAATRRAVSLLRAAGFKIVLHWMPNLLGATPESDRLDFVRLWSDPALRPDEIKIYPCQLLEGAALVEHWRQGAYAPYPTDVLLSLVADLKLRVPAWCRINRIVRDIPSGAIVAGNRRSSLRQDAQRALARRGRRCRCIRCREVRGVAVAPQRLRRRRLRYSAGGAVEHFLERLTDDGRLAAYLRLSLPGPGSPVCDLPDLEGAALVRELHVYGEALPLGASDPHTPQHQGLGTDLLEEAARLARAAGYARLAVIAALGTRDYYRRLGFGRGESYMVRALGREAGDPGVDQ